MQISIAPPTEITYFKTAEVKSLDGMAELCLKNNFSPAIFTGGKRNLASFKKAYCLGLDVDNDGKEYKGPDASLQGKPTPFMSLEEAKEVFKEYTHLILPSRSHQKLKDGEVADRFRVILFFTEPITDLDTFYATWHWCKQQWPAIDHQCKDPSRFYYVHSAIASTRAKGIRVTPVPPAPKEEKEVVDRSRPSSTDRGKLSREALEFLLDGSEKGGRNATTYKVAKEFQQNLYSLEEATEKIVGALELSGTIASDFTEDEVRLTIQSAYKTEAKHEPRIKPKAFNLLPIGDVYKTNSKIEWLVDHLLTVGGVSLLSSEPKGGKSVLVRQLMREIVRGNVFLGRKCKQGVVQYYALEEQIEVLNVAFQRLGIMPTEPLYTHVGDPLSDGVLLNEFRDQILETKPALAVVDTMFDLLTAEENNYKEVKRELRAIRKIARESGTHILLVHHNSKGDSNPKYKRRGQRSVLGSTAIVGGVDTIMVMDVDGYKRFLTVTGREVRRFDNCLMKFNYQDCTYAIGPEVDEY